MSVKNDKYVKGRGAQTNPSNRFHTLRKVQEHWEGIDVEEEINPKTKFIEVFPKTIVNKVDSPDVRMDYSLNPYQGCEHGCTYCYARPTHEYWGYSAGVDFEQIILVKKNAPELLEHAFRSKNWQVLPIMLSGNTDCYQPCEKKFGITRRLLELMLQYKHPVSIITKNSLLLRDLDILSDLAKLNLVSVNISITTLDEGLRSVLEPRTATAKRKLQAIELLSENDIPVNIMLAPIIPAINDYEIFNVLKEVSERGALSAHYQMARLNGPNQQIFTDWVTKNFADRASKVLHQLKEIHGDNLGDSRFVTRMVGEGPYSLNIKRQFELAKKRFFTGRVFPRLRTDLFEKIDRRGQTTLF